MNFKIWSILKQKYFVVTIVTIDGHEVPVRNFLKNYLQDVLATCDIFCVCMNGHFRV